MPENNLVYLIAGEASGDLLGGRLMMALKQQAPDTHFAGIGGATMEAAGLQPLFPMHELSVMGLVEVLKHAPRLLQRIRETADDILRQSPAVLVTIDAPDFCFRVARRVRKGNPNIRLVHYVAPSVWAWRPKRAKKVAQFLDHLLALLPFEPPYFTREGLACTFVGHPAAETIAPGDRTSFRTRHRIDSERRIILLLPGSRQGEVERLLPLFLDVAESLQQENPDLLFIVPTLPHLLPMIQRMTDARGVDCRVIGQKDKPAAFAAAHAALAASGTVALELGLARVPAVIAYKVNPVSAWLARRLVRLKHVSLINLILGREIMPEFLQEQALTSIIQSKMQEILIDSPVRDAQLAAGAEVAAILRPGGREPSAIAAEIVIGEMRCSAGEATISSAHPMK